MSENPIDITVQRTALNDRLERATVIPEMLTDEELGALVRTKIRHLLLITENDPGG